MPDKRKREKKEGDDCIDLNHLRINSFHVFIYIHILSFCVSMLLLLLVSFYSSFTTTHDTPTVDDVDDDESQIHDIHIKSSEWQQKRLNTKLFCPLKRTLQFTLIFLVCLFCPQWLTFCRILF